MKMLTTSGLALAVAILIVVIVFRKKILLSNKNVMVTLTNSNWSLTAIKVAAVFFQIIACMHYIEFVMVYYPRVDFIFVTIIFSLMAWYSIEYMIGAGILKFIDDDIRLTFHRVKKYLLIPLILSPCFFELVELVVSTLDGGHSSLMMHHGMKDVFECIFTILGLISPELIFKILMVLRINNDSL